MLELNNKITFDDVERVVFEGEKLSLSGCVRAKVEECFDFLEGFVASKVIYGINTGFGPMAQYRIPDKSLKELQYNLIRSHVTGAGQNLPDLYVRAVMLSRLGTFLQAKSGVHVELLDLLVDFLNNHIYPQIPEHGSVGASGDLVQLAHMALALIGEGSVSYGGEVRPSRAVMDELGLCPFNIRIREGLAITNGTAVMTGIGLVNLIYALRLLDWATVASVLMNEIASSYGDLMSEELNSAKEHHGQNEIARIMRLVSDGSLLIRDRKYDLYSEESMGKNVFDRKVQAYYSLRCAPQILGPVYDTVLNARKVLLSELNSACDNPIVDAEAKNVFHGGNFHGDYVSFEMDKLKIAITKLTVLVERQLNYLCHDKINGILPPFLNMGVLGLNYGMQAAQFTATSTTAENQMLSNPMYVHSIPNNNDNQDVVSMGTNSAWMARRVIDNAWQVMSIHVLALVQAVDCLEISSKLSKQTGSVYREIRAMCPLCKEDKPMNGDIEKVNFYLRNRVFNNLHV